MKRAKRHVLAVGWIGEWNLPPYPGGTCRVNGLSFHRRGVDIVGAKRRKGMRAVRVRVVLEEL